MGSTTGASGLTSLVRPEHFGGEQLSHLLHHGEVIRFAARAALEQRIDVSGAALHEHDLRAFELPLHRRLDDTGIVGRVLTAGGAEHDGVRGVVDEQRLRAPVRVFDAKQHELGIDRTVRNAIEVVEQRARPAVLTEEETVVAQLQGSLSRRRAAPGTWIGMPFRSRRKSCARARRGTTRASSLDAGALPNGRNAGAECVCDAESSSTGMSSFEATSRRRLSDTRLPTSAVTSAIRESPASRTSTFANSGSCVPLAGPHFRLE